VDIIVLLGRSAKSSGAKSTRLAYNLVVDNSNAFCHVFGFSKLIIWGIFGMDMENVPV
jgi:hypothetical protein